MAEAVRKFDPVNVLTWLAVLIVCAAVAAAWGIALAPIAAAVFR